MDLLLQAVCQLEAEYEVQYMDDDEKCVRAIDELTTAWRVLLNKWGHLLDDEQPNDTARKVRGLP